MIPFQLSQVKSLYEFWIIFQDMNEKGKKWKQAAYYTLWAIFFHAVHLDVPYPTQTFKKYT